MYRNVSLVEKRVHTIHVVEVTVRAEDVADSDVEPLGLLEDEVRIPGGIDDRALASRLVPDEIDEVVPWTKLEPMNEDFSDRFRSQNSTTLRIDLPRCIRSNASLIVCREASCG